MNHLERLLSRALAVPRDAARPLFDPFDRVAPLPLDAPPPLHVARAAAHEGAPAPAGTHASPQPAAATSSPVRPPTSMAVDVAPPSPIPTLDALLQPPSPVAPPTAPHAASPAPVDASPQGRADAFMRALGVALSEPPAATKVAASPRPASTPAASIETPRITAPRPAIAAHEAAAARPPTPGRVPPPSAAAKDLPAPAPMSVRRAPPAAPIEHVVERTVVVSTSTSSGFDELAHASRIVRFGIGQG